MGESNYKIHLMYWAIIFVVLALFLTLCVPGKINDEAFSNFSFASVLVSIVLAVISIVLSISVGQTTSQYNLQIKDVEKEIQEKLKRFDDLDSSIRSSVECVVKKEVEDVKKSQVEMNKSIESLIMSTNSKVPKANKQGESLDLSGVSYLCVASLYLASLCFKKKKPLPISQLHHSTAIIVGFLNALSTLEPENMSIEVQNNDIFVTRFSSSRWGNQAALDKAIDEMGDSGIKKQVIEAGKYLVGE